MPGILAQHVPLYVPAQLDVGDSTIQTRIIEMKCYEVKNPLPWNLKWKIKYRKTQPLSPLQDRKENEKFLTLPKEQSPTTQHQLLKFLHYPSQPG